MNTIKDKVDSEKYITGTDIRTRDRANVNKIEIDSKSLLDLSDKITNFSIPQPALGVATKIVGCNCQTCRSKKIQFFVD